MSIKLLCSYLVQHMLHQINAQQFYTDLDSYQQFWVQQKIVKFKDFLRPLSDFPVLFKADLIFKDFSSKPSKFKYFSSLWEPCIHSAPLRGDLKLFERLNQAHPKKHVELPSTQRCNERMMWYCKFGNFREGFIFVKLPIFKVSWK